MSLIRSGADTYLDRFENKDFSPDLECLHEESDSEVAQRCQQVVEYLGMSYVYLPEIFLRLWHTHTTDTKTFNTHKHTQHTHTHTHTHATGTREEARIALVSHAVYLHSLIQMW